MSESPRAARDQGAKKAAGHRETEMDQQIQAGLIEVMASFRPHLFAGFSFLVGCYVGHRFELFRERRREFNIAVEPVRAWVLTEIDCPLQGYVKAPTLIQVDALTHCIPIWKRRGFRKAWAEQAKGYETRGEYDPATGGGITTLFEPRIAALRACLPYLQRR